MLPPSPTRSDSTTDTSDTWSRGSDSDDDEWSLTSWSNNGQPVRENRSTLAAVENHELENPFAQGKFRYVARGKYTRGERKGERCAIKWLKSGHVYEAEAFDHDIDAIQQAIDIVRAWNERECVQVRVNKGTVWVFISDDEWKDRKSIVEPYIKNFQKFNSNTGWADNESDWARSMQALSHFSYEFSKGQILLCDLQGGVYQNEIILSDPVILSRKRRFGPADLGVAGISSFFRRHCCNEYCSKKWRKPREKYAVYDASSSTEMRSTRSGCSKSSMELVVPVVVAD